MSLRESTEGGGNQYIMTKFTIFIILLFCLTLGIAPGTSADIHGPNECCFLDHDLTDVDSNCQAGMIVGPQRPKWCDPDGDGTPNTPDAYSQRWATCCFLDSVYTVSDWLFMAFIALTLIMFGIAGYLFLFSGGAPSNIEKSRNFLIWGIVALTLVLLSKVIPAIIKGIVS